jgi:signal transduction histidine kinase
LLIIVAVPAIGRDSCQIGQGVKKDFFRQAKFDMSQFFTIKTHPFRFLLYLEGALLLFSIFSEVALPSPILSSQITRFPNWIGFIILILWGIGFRVPKRGSPYRLGYILLNLLLVFLIAILGGSGRTLPFLYLIVLIRACLIYSIKQQIMIASLTFVLFLFTLSHRLGNLSLSGEVREQVELILPSFIILFFLIIIFVLILINTLLAERESRNQLSIAHEKLRQYALKIEEQATLQERNRIAREIHDSIGHVLTALNLQLEGGLKLWNTDPETAYSFVQKGKELASTALQEIRKSVSSLRSDPLAEKTLEEAIESSLKEVESATDIQTQLHLKNSYLLSPETARTIYRLIQEALTNVTKHAAASQVNISLEVEENVATLKITDNGKGFNYEENTTGFGLQGMRERTLSLGGTFKVISALEKGCQIEAVFPVRGKIL